MNTQKRDRAIYIRNKMRERADALHAKGLKQLTVWVTNEESIVIRRGIAITRALGEHIAYIGCTNSDVFYWHGVMRNGHVIFEVPFDMPLKDIRVEVTKIEDKAKQNE